MFGYNGAKLWNELPCEIKNAESLVHFNSLLHATSLLWSYSSFTYFKINLSYYCIMYTVYLRILFFFLRRSWKSVSNCKGQRG